MDKSNDYDLYDRNSIKLLEDLIDAAGSAISQTEIDNKWDAVRCGEIDSAIEGMIDLSGVMHWYVIPSTLSTSIQEWLESSGTPGPDDDDYPWYAVERALSTADSRKIRRWWLHNLPTGLYGGRFKVIMRKLS